jgi:4-hydroxybenzoate polyprenyltransferase
MGRALLILGWLATAGLLATGLIGFQVDPARGVGLHLLVGLFSSLLILFSHSWIMFYLIGTGKALKSAVAEHDLDREIVARTIDFKNRSYPWLMAAIGVVMATFIIGGGVATRVIPPWIHAVLFALALLVQVRTMVLESEVILANDRLMRTVDQQIASR